MGEHTSPHDTPKRGGRHDTLPQSALPTPTPPTPSSHHQLTSSDFVFGPILGEGLFGKVYYARKKETSSPSSSHVAIKVADKHHVLRRNKVQEVLRECQLLIQFATLSSPWVVRLHASFEDCHHLFWVQEWCSGGSLQTFIQEGRHIVPPAHAQQKLGLLVSTEQVLKWVQSVGVQLLQAVEHIHGQGIVHGDLSANNVMFTSQGRIKIIDFGCAIDVQSIMTRNQQTGGKSGAAPINVEFAGTADYVAPEIILGTAGITKRSGNPQYVDGGAGDGGTDEEEDHYLLAAIDLWSFACLLYFMLVRESPFHSETDQLAMCKILDFVRGTQTIHWPPYSSLSHHNDHEVIKSLIHGILIENPSLRLGSHDKVITKKSDQYSAIRKHPFFVGADWEDISIHLPKKETDGYRNLNQLEDMTDGALVDFLFFA